MESSKKSRVHVGNVSVSFELQRHSSCHEILICCQAALRERPDSFMSDSDSEWWCYPGYVRQACVCVIWRRLDSNTGRHRPQTSLLLTTENSRRSRIHRVDFLTHHRSYRCGSFEIQRSSCFTQLSIKTEKQGATSAWSCCSFFHHFMHPVTETNMFIISIFSEQIEQLFWHFASALTAVEYLLHSDENLCTSRNTNTKIMNQTDCKPFEKPTRVEVKESTWLQYCFCTFNMV